MFQDCKERSNPGLKVMTFRPKEVSLLLIHKDSFFFDGNEINTERKIIVTHP
jgi:hypothetical protein